MNIVIAASDSGDNGKGWQIYVAWIQAINDHSKRTCSLHTALICLTCRGCATQTIKRLLCVEKWCGLQVFYYVRGVCQEMMWSASVLLRAIFYVGFVYNYRYIKTAKCQFNTHLLLLSVWVGILLQCGKHLQTTSFLDTLLARNKTLADIISWHTPRT
jgi:hypothetical protein